MSLGQLQDIDVMSVTRTVEPLQRSPAAVYVITREAIARSGYSTVPDILRLAPNLQVKQITASRYIITARGFSGSLDAQNFANKLLVLIDGRSVYTPLYSGVYWDMQDVVPADIERIEVISGPVPRFGARTMSMASSTSSRARRTALRVGSWTFRWAISSRRRHCDTAGRRERQHGGQHGAKSSAKYLPQNRRLQPGRSCAVVQHRLLGPANLVRCAVSIAPRKNDWSKSSIAPLRRSGVLLRSSRRSRRCAAQCNDFGFYEA
jgi:hypothetical protein